MSDIPPRLPPRLRQVPTPKPQPDQFALVDAVRDLTTRVGTLETKMGVLFKRSVITVVCADVLLGAAKLVLEFFTK